MNIMKLDFLEILRVLLAMSLTGSTVSLFLFIWKPFIKSRMPKSFQYYMWLSVLIALLLPLPKMITLPKPAASNNSAISLMPIYDMVQGIEKTQVSFSNVPMIFFMVWQFGIFIFLGTNIIYYWLFVRKLKTYSVCASPHETELLHKLSGKSRAPHLYLNPAVPTPMLIGIFRPIIVLPDKEYTDTQLHNILLHELTHLQRHDIIIKWLSILAGALHWFHPMVYLVRREISRACELACDEAVIKNLDAKGKQSYGDALIAVVADKTIKTPLSTTMCEDKRTLRERLGTIMNYKNFSKRTMVLSGIFLAIILCGTLYLGAAGRADSTKGTGIITTYADTDPMQKEKHEKEIELKEILRNFDKENIVETWAFLGNADNKITDANILIVSHEEITDSVKQNELLLLAAESLNLDSKNIHVEYMDVETFTSLEKETN